MKKIKYTLTIPLILFSLYFNAIAFDSFKVPEENEIYALHTQLGFNYDLYNINSNGFKGSVDCGVFTKGFGWGIPLVVEFEKYLFEKSFFSIGLGYHINSGYLVQEIKFPMRDISSGKVLEVSTENQMDIDFGFFEFSAHYGQNILEKSDFVARLVGGIKFGLATGKTFTQKEVIVSPSSAVFVNADDFRTKQRPLASGDIQTMSVPLIVPQLALEALTNNLGTYRFSIGYQLNNYTTDTDWKSVSMKFEVGYRLSIFEKVAEEPPVEIEESVKPVPIVVEKQEDPIFNIKAIDIEGKIEYGNELLSSLPIVNSVFFESNSSTIPSNYNNKENLESYLTGDAIKVHNHILPRIAEIVTNNSKSSIVLQSATSGEENETNINELSKNRASIIKVALVALGINENKIKLEVLQTPKNPSNQQYREGVLENQRVDIIIKNAPLQEYVDLQKYANFKGKVNLEIMALNLAGKSVEITNNLTHQIIRVDNSGNYDLELDFKLNPNKGQEEIKFQYKLGNTEKEISEIIDYSKFQREQVDLNLDDFLAILRFDYNSSIVTEENKELLRQLIEKLPDGVTIKILGSADELGTPQRNALLAKERADNTMNFIKSIAQKQINIEVGTSNEKFTEITPQGRFLNRSIRIRVIKK